MRAFNLYSAFVYTDSFSSAVEEIPSKAIKEAILLWGIGDSLACSESGFFYDFEEGNLVEPEVKKLLEVLEDSEYRANYNAIATVGIAYEEWANEQREESNSSAKELRD